MREKIYFLTLLLFFVSCSDKNNPESKENVISPKKSQSDIISCSFFSETDIIPKVAISGTISSKNKVDLFSEVSGKLYSRKNKFKVGNEFRKGQTLIRIEASDLRLEIKSVKSEFLSLLIQCLPDIKLDYPNSFEEWESYVGNFNIEKRMRKLPNLESKKLRNFLSGKGVYSLFYRIMSLENKLDKFSIKAPFDCVVTQSFLSKGSNVLLGQRLGQIIDKNNYEISTSLGISDSELFSIGDKAILASDDIEKSFSATIKRKGNHINSLTQSIDVFFDVSDKNVKDGMFVKGEVFGKKLENIYKVPRNKIVNNKFVFLRDSSWDFEDSNPNNNGLEVYFLKEKEVQVIYFENDSVIIKGLENKDCVVDNYRTYFYDGMKIN